MKIVIAGGSGQVGTILARAFRKRGADVVILSRSAAGGPGRGARWDGKTLGPWTAELDGAAALVNLTGRSVNCRYSAANRRAIIDSRVDSTRVLGEAIARCKVPPAVWLQASTATIYAHRYDVANDEASGIIGGNEPDVPETWRFSIEVAKAWEQALDEAPATATRRVKLRAAMIMSPDAGGVFDTLLGLVRRGLGGAAGDGEQYVSWIHHRDFVRSVEFLLERPELDGAINVCSPGPVPNAEFMRALRDAWGARFGLPASRWMLEVGAFFLRTETELVLKSRRVVPGRLLQAGFEFEFPSWPEAAAELCQSVRTGTDEPDEPDDEVVTDVAALPIEDSIDLHGFQPRDVPAVVASYLEAAAEKGFVEVRLIHGRGKGVQRARVQALLGTHPLVESFRDAPASRGGWGATVVELKAQRANPTLAS
ncbi:MAG TPA: TIGR01777 family oxidoreductase [Polyangiaceae bacterium]|nr:TIGR01777 family oxidoreductase [Polyangiaceae bacterium]